MLKFEKAAQNVYYLDLTSENLGETVTFINGNRRFLIDSGSSDRSVTEAILPALHSMGYGLRDIDYMLFTHCHPENMGGAHKIRELSSRIKMIAYATQREAMKNPTYYLNKICGIFPDNAPPYPELPGILPSAIIRTDEEDPVFSDLIPFSAEGHSADGVMWFHPASGTLVTGDAVQGKGTPETGIPYAQFTNCYRDVLKDYETTGIVNYQTMITGRTYSGDSPVISGELNCRKFFSESREYIDEKKAEFENYVKINRLHKNESAAERYVKETFGNSPEVELCYPLITFYSMITPNEPEKFYTV